jgi:hypothetical protein
MFNAPRIVPVGNLNKIVQANGNNNDDGNGWTKTVGDKRQPPAPIDKGILALLIRRR